MVLGYSASVDFENLDELYEFVEDFEIDYFEAHGPSAPMWEMEEDDAYSLLESSPRTRYRLTLGHSDTTTVKISSMIGPIPQLQLVGEIENYDSFHEFRQFLNNQNIAWK